MTLPLQLPVKAFESEAHLQYPLLTLAGSKMEPELAGAGDTADPAAISVDFSVAPLPPRYAACIVQPTPLHSHRGSFGAEAMVEAASIGVHSEVRQISYASVRDGDRFPAACSIPAAGSGI